MNTITKRAWIARWTGCTGWRQLGDCHTTLAEVQHYNLSRHQAVAGAFFKGKDPVVSVKHSLMGLCGGPFPCTPLLCLYLLLSLSLLFFPVILRSFDCLFVLSVVAVLDTLPSFCIFSLSSEECPFCFRVFCPLSKVCAWQWRCWTSGWCKWLGHACICNCMAGW